MDEAQLEAYLCFHLVLTLDVNSGRSLKPDS